MPPYLEAWKPRGTERIGLPSARLTIGKSPDNDLTLADPTVSRLHAVLERMSSGWVVRDLGSRNGTFLNGERLSAQRALRSGDELRVGHTRLVYHADVALAQPSTTAVVDPAPELTRRERSVLLELCRPLLARDMLSEPATVALIAGRLVLADDTVKKCLQRIYDKFDVEAGQAGTRRARLAAEAIRRGAVSLADVAS